MSQGRRGRQRGKPPGAKPRPEGKKPSGHKQKTTGKKATGKKAKPSKAKKRRAVPVVDPSDTADTETRYIQPYEAVKTYLCPGCNREIPPGMGHIVAIPPDAPDLRRHWHRGCWNNRASRR